MTRVRDFFLTEAGECVSVARAELADDRPDPARLHSAVRRLRGSAELARLPTVAEAAAAMEVRLKPLARSRAAWTDALAEQARLELNTVESAVEAVRTGRLEPEQRREDDVDQGQTDGVDEVVAIEDLEYRGRPALERALELRPALEEAIAGDEPAQPILEEVFDLVRLGMS